MAELSILWVNPYPNILQICLVFYLCDLSLKHEKITLVILSQPVAAIVDY